MMSKVKILIPDGLHINKKNFASFFDFMESESVECHFESSRDHMITRFGDYRFDSSIRRKSECLEKFSFEDLKQEKVHGIRLFEVCRAEFLSYVAVHPEWYDSYYPESVGDLFELSYRRNKEDLLLNLAAAWDWIDFWCERVEALPEFDCACIFSGSLIYQKALIEVLKTKKTRVFLMESFFTGNDFYCEEKYDHISNNSDIKFDAIYKSILLPDDKNMLESEKNKALNKVVMANNKNVVQPLDGKELLFKDDNALTVVVFGQVVNDFSLIEYNGVGLASVRFYKDLIRVLVDSGVNVVFKSHPWEEKKNNVRAPLTRMEIESFVSDQGMHEQVLVVDNYPIERLFSLADYVVGLNSQSLIEAAFHGFKPIQFGEAFYGGRGFTTDMGITSLKSVGDLIVSGEISGKLTLSEYDEFEVFLMKLLQYHLVSVHPSGVLKLKEKILKKKYVSLVEPKIKKGGANKKLQSNKSVSAKVVTNSKSLVKRRLNKLIAKPHDFFRDSNVRILRPLRHLF